MPHSASFPAQVMYSTVARIFTADENVNAEVYSVSSETIGAWRQRAVVPEGEDGDGTADPITEVFGEKDVVALEKLLLNSCVPCFAFIAIVSGKSTLAKVVHGADAPAFEKAFKETLPKPPEAF